METKDSFLLEMERELAFARYKFKLNSLRLEIKQVLSRAESIQDQRPVVQLIDEFKSFLIEYIQFANLERY